MKTILVTGSQGFIGSYICSDLLEHGYKVIGVDNYSKYGLVHRKHDNHPNFKMYIEDLSRDRVLHSSVAYERPDIIIAGAAKIGGITYFHKYAYDLLATNERILANTFDMARRWWKNGTLERIVVMSSSMVFESATEFPVKESDVSKMKIPLSSYGFQKLAVEYFARAAHEQYGVPYSIIRPFNAVGAGEDKALGEHEMTSGDVKLTMSHVLPDLINKVLLGQNPLHLLGSGEQVRCYTNGKDIARGIRMVMESEAAINEDFNISTPTPTTVLELARLVWKKINGDKEFSYICDDPMTHDVQFRLPDVSKAERLLGFKAEIDLEESVDEVVGYIKSRKLLS